MLLKRVPDIGDCVVPSGGPEAEVDVSACSKDVADWALDMRVAKEGLAEHFCPSRGEGVKKRSSNGAPSRPNAHKHM